VFDRWRDIPAFLRTPLGRKQLLYRGYYSAWPLLRRGATFYRRTLGRKPRVVTVVGSFGKTTTARAVTAALGGKPPPDIIPNAWNFLAHAILCLRPQQQHKVIEVGISRKGQMQIYAGMIRPDITVVTCIGSEHNRSLGTLKVTRAEKSEMVRSLSTSGTAVLNGDDSDVRWMKRRTRARVVTFGLNEASDIRATNVMLDWPHGTRFELHTDGQIRNLRIRLIGRHMVYPILAAVGVALSEGFELDQILPGLEALPPTPGRLQPIRLASGGYLLRDEYKSSLETIETALDVLSQIPAKRRIVVLGDVSEPPGSQGPIYRHIGKRIAEIASRAVILGRNFQRYAAGATRAGFPRDALFDAGLSVLGAVHELQQTIGPGDVALIKGRDTQRLDRIALAIMGRKVKCDISFCNATLMRCDNCPMLERGWRGCRVVM